MQNQNIRHFQQALKAAGYNPGAIDGLWGANTRGAMQKWQRDTKRPITTVMMAEDLALLTGTKTSGAQEILWIVEAQKLLGLKEGAGKLNNPIILEWGENLDVNYPTDDIAWCGLFVAHTMSMALPNEPLPANVLGARQWMKFGQEVAPQDGAVAVFWRGSKAGWQGHVGYMVGESTNSFTVLGGNQSDAVTYTSIAKNRLLGAYWPKTAGAPLNLKLPPKPQLRLSTNEA